MCEHVVMKGHVSWGFNRACHPGGHYYDFYPGALPLSQINAIHLKIGHLQISPGCSNELQRLPVKLYMEMYQGPLLLTWINFNLIMDK